MISRLPVVLLVMFAISLPLMAHAEKPKTSEAAFKVEGLSEQKLVKRLAKALADLDGVLTSRADASKGKFFVTYDAAKVDSATILAKIQSVVPNATSDEEKQPNELPVFAPEEHRCGGCPMRNKCGGHD